MTTATNIHGGSDNNPNPAFDRMFDTLAKRCKVDKMKDYVPSHKKLTEKVVCTEFKRKSKAFERAQENIKRSLAVIHSNGVMRQAEIVCKNCTI